MNFYLFKLSIPITFVTERVVHRKEVIEIESKEYLLKMASLNIGAQPFVKWPGQKSQHIHILTQALPSDFAEMTDVTYIEPFVGGGSLLFHMLQTYPNIKRAIINDSNLDLIRAYNTVRDRAKELIAELKKIQKEFLPLDEEERHEYFNEMRDEFNARLSDGLRHSALFIFLNKTSNASYRTNGNGKFNGAYNHLQNPVICDEHTILADSKLLQRVTITYGDYEKTYSEACGNTFFFLDPPYRPTGKHHRNTDFNDKEQIRLKKFCDLLSFRHFQWMLTNSDGKCQNPDDTFMEQLYSNYNVERIWSKNAIVAKPEKRDKLSELLVRNFSREILSLRDVHCRQLSFAF